jgi:hypothetical protein
MSPLAISAPRMSRGSTKPAGPHPIRNLVENDLNLGDVPSVYLK